MLIAKPTSAPFVLTIATIVFALCVATSRPGSATALLETGGSVWAGDSIELCRTQYNASQSSYSVSFSAFGSGAARNLFNSGRIAIGFTDFPYQPDSARPADSTMIPIFATGIAVIHKITGIDTSLKLSPLVIAKIFGNQIRLWNDPQIQSLNPTLLLPAEPITVIYPNAGSALSNGFTAYLRETASTVWTNPASDIFSRSFPGSLPSDGTFVGAAIENIPSTVAATAGGVSFVNLKAAVQSSGFNFAAVLNPSGQYVTPSYRAIQIASDSTTVGGFNSLSGNVDVNYLPSRRGAYPVWFLNFALASKTTSPNSLGARQFLDSVMGSCAIPNDGTFPSMVCGRIRDFALQRLALAASSDPAQIGPLVSDSIDCPSYTEPPPTFSAGTSTTATGTSGSTATTYTATATDPDNDTLTYAITGGTHANTFNINSTTGVLTFKDNAVKGTYTVTVTASDGTATATQTVTLTVAELPNGGSSTTTSPASDSTVPTTSAPNKPIIASPTMSSSKLSAVSSLSRSTSFRLSTLLPRRDLRDLKWTATGRCNVAAGLLISQAYPGQCKVTLSAYDKRLKKRAVILRRSYRVR